LNSIVTKIGNKNKAIFVHMNRMSVISCIIVVFILTMLTASGKQAWLIADVIEIDFVLGSV